VWVVLPLACLAGGAFAVYLVARLLTDRNDVLALVTTLVFAAGLGTLSPLFVATRAAFRTVRALPAWGHFGSGGAFLRADPGALVVVGVALGLGMVVAIYSGCYLTLDRRYETYYPLLLLLVTGLVGMVLATDLFNLYMFCELMSVSAYTLVAFRRRTDTAIEAGFKYLIMGSLGTAIILLGISFIYRERGQLVLPQMTGAPGTLIPQGAGVAQAGPWTRAGLACFLGYDHGHRGDPTRIYLRRVVLLRTAGGDADDGASTPEANRRRSGCGWAQGRGQSAEATSRTERGQAMSRRWWS